MEMVRDQWGPFDTVYIGGGTPSVLTLKQLESILAHVQKTFALLPDTEITVEANPGDLNLPFLRDLRKHGNQSSQHWDSIIRSENPRFSRDADIPLSKRFQPLRAPAGLDFKTWDWI